MKSGHNEIDSLQLWSLAHFTGLWVGQVDVVGQLE